MPLLSSSIKWGIGVVSILMAGLQGPEKTPHEAVAQSAGGKPPGAHFKPSMIPWTLFMKVCSGLPVDGCSAQSQMVGLDQS